MIKLGSHVAFKKPDYLVGSIKESLANNANCAMIYLGAPQTAARVNVDQYMLDEYFAEYAGKIAPKDIVIHAPYIINMASKTKSEFARNFLISEINRANQIGSQYIVLHPGSATDLDKNEALDQLIENLKFVLNRTENLIICIETMAGKGNEICTNFEDIMYVINNVNSKRIAICLDTCHVWDAGYNIKDYDDFKNILIEQNALKHIKVIHLNDSANTMGSHKDRHANIGNGFIGLEVLKKFVWDRDFDDLPIILETPYINNVFSPYKDEIALLLDK